MDIPLYLLKPPYLVANPLTDQGESIPCDNGILIAVRPLDSSSTSSIESTINQVLLKYPREAVVLWTDLLPSNRAILLTANARMHGVRARMSSAVWTPDSVRDQLCDLGDFALQLSLWLQRRGVALSMETEYLLRTLAKGTKDHTTLALIAKRSGRSEWAWRRWFRNDNLGAPRLWLRMLRTLRHYVHLQAHPYQSLASVAASLGYYDAAAFRRQTKKIFGLAPRDIRHCLGWEWLLHSACLRAALRLDE